MGGEGPRGGGLLNASFNIRSLTPLFNLQYIILQLVYPILGFVGSSLIVCKRRGGGVGPLFIQPTLLTIKPNPIQSILNCVYHSIELNL